VPSGRQLRRRHWGVILFTYCIHPAFSRPDRSSRAWIAGHDHTGDTLKEMPI
jgi:hypothetical protein